MPWNHIPTLDQLEALVFAADAGSIGQAAATLHVGQQTLSARIAAAERTLGLAVFTRNSRGVCLTAQGEEIVEEVRRLLAGVGRLDDRASRLRNPQGALRVASSNTITEALLPEWAAQMRIKFPALDIRTLPGNSTQVAAHVLSGRADIGVIESPSVPAHVKVRPVGTDRLVVVVPHDHPWASSTTVVTRAEVEATPMVLREPGSGTRELIDLALPNLPEPIHIAHTNAEARAACRTLAVPTILSELASMSDISAGHLKAVPVADLEMERLLRVVVPLRGRLSPIAQAFTEIATRFSSVSP